jgi:alpha-mannosidase
VLEALKRAEDSTDVVLRAYEPHGGRGVVRVRLGFAVAEAWRADLLERPGERVDVRPDGDGAEIELSVRPFEIVTLLLRPPSRNPVATDGVKV